MLSAPLWAVISLGIQKTTPAWPFYTIKLLNIPREINLCRSSWIWQMFRAQPPGKEGGSEVCPLETLPWFLIGQRRLPTCSVETFHPCETRLFTTLTLWVGSNVRPWFGNSVDERNRIDTDLHVGSLQRVLLSIIIQNHHIYDHSFYVLKSCSPPPHVLAITQIQRVLGTLL